MKTTYDRIPGTPYGIYQYENRFRYGMDAVLLSWCARAEKEDVCIDLCSGTGIVALRHHYIYRPQKTYAIEMQEEMAQLCMRSVVHNGLPNRLHCLAGDFTRMETSFVPGGVQVVMANPPYIRKGHGKHSPHAQVAMARHEITMSLNDLFSFARRVLPSGGRFYMIHRPGRLGEILSLSHAYHLPVKEILPVSSRKGDDPQLVLVSCRKDGKVDLVLKTPLFVYENDCYTTQMQRIYEGAVR